MDNVFRLRSSDLRFTELIEEIVKLLPPYLNRNGILEIEYGENTEKVQFNVNILFYVWRMRNEMVAAIDLIAPSQYKFKKPRH